MITHFQPFKDMAFARTLKTLADLDVYERYEAKNEHRAPLYGAPVKHIGGPKPQKEQPKKEKKKKKKVHKKKVDTKDKETGITNKQAKEWEWDDLSKPKSETRDDKAPTKENIPVWNSDGKPKSQEVWKNQNKQNDKEGSKVARFSIASFREELEEARAKVQKQVEARDAEVEQARIADAKVKLKGELHGTSSDAAPHPASASSAVESPAIDSNIGTLRVQEEEEKSEEGRNEAREPSQLQLTLELTSARSSGASVSALRNVFEDFIGDMTGDLV